MARLGNLLTLTKKQNKTNKQKKPTEVLEPECLELNPPSLTMRPWLHCLPAPLHLHYL